MDELHSVVAAIKKLRDEQGETPTKDEAMASGISDQAIRRCGGFLKVLDAAGMTSRRMKSNIVEKTEPKILVFDIETKPILAWVWQTYGDMNIGPEMIVEDWSVLCWSAKWLGEKEVFFEDQRENAPLNLMNDEKILRSLWKLLDEADVVISQNGKKFDIKKVYARFLKHKMPPPSSFRHIDTKEIAKRLYGLTKNSLAYMSNEFNDVFKKLDHGKFPGMKLWLECMAGNKKAWDEMKRYNKHDVLALEELYIKMRPWIKDVNFSVYNDEPINTCSCGGQEFASRGYRYTNTGKYRRLVCKQCGQEYAEKANLLSKEKRESLIKTV